MLWFMFYGMNFDILTNKKARLDGYRPCPLPLSAGRLPFLVKKA
jgi:hypothetical protein